MDNIQDCGPPQIYWQFPAERACGFITQKVKSLSAANRNLSLAILRASQFQLLTLLYTKIVFTTSKPDVEMQLATYQENSANPYYGFHAISALTFLDVNRRQYSTNHYAERGISLLHHHAIPPKPQILSGAEKNRMVRFLEDHYGGNPNQVLCVRELTVQKFSHCLLKYQIVRSRLAPQTFSIREAHHVAYSPCDENGDVKAQVRDLPKMGISQCPTSS